MSNNVIETFVGALVIAVAAFFLHFAYKTTDVKLNDNSYNVYANFEQIDGINLGGDVKIGGVKVGKISDIALDLQSYMAKVELAIVNDYKLPLDSSAAIISSGLIGDKYISITPGNEEEFLKEGMKIEFTQSSISIEALIGKFLFDSAGKEEK